jgi:hypothetical protein
MNPPSWTTPLEPSHFPFNADLPNEVVEIGLGNNPKKLTISALERLAV